MSRKIAVIDYGLGNLFNLHWALETIGAHASITSDPSVVLRADAAVLPGVGAFGDGMQGLAGLGLLDAVRQFAATGKPLLGICLGMQLLMSQSEEFGHHEGLGIIEGKVVKFTEAGDSGLSYKIPQIAWNRLLRPRGAQADASDPWKGTILESQSAPEPYMYFVHSYIVVPDRQENCLAETEYGRDLFCSVIRKGNVYGCQFHPERSSVGGLLMLKSFVEAPS
jgi:glutamine amidotransferase